MRVAWACVLGAGLAIIAGVAVRAQAAEHVVMQPKVAFTFERQGMPVPRYTLVVLQDGSGQYQGEEASRPGGPPGSALPEVAGQTFDRSFQISAAGSAKIFATAQHLRMFNVNCGSKAKNVADTGAKTLSYDGPDGKGSCAYHYSDNKDVTALTAVLQGIAETLDEGRKLDRMRRFDRLGLDAELAAFAGEVKDGFAVEVGAIAETLKAIAGNTEVMERARGRAVALLKSADAGP